MPIMFHEPAALIFGSVAPSFLAAGVSVEPLGGQWTLVLITAVGVMYRNWRADEADRRKENLEANRAVTAGLEVLKDEKHGERLDALNAKLANIDKLDGIQAEFREFQRAILERFDSIDRRLSAQPQSLQRIVPTVPEDEPRATG